MTTPNAGIPEVEQGTLDPAAGLNLALNVIDALLQTRVISMSLTAPPVSPQDGDRYIPAEPATGDWTGLGNHMVRYVAEGTFWQPYVPGVQVNLVLNLADGGFYKYIPGSPASWTLAAGLSDAPIDGLRYVRRNGAWEVISALLNMIDSQSPALLVPDVDVIQIAGSLQLEEIAGGVARLTATGPEITAPFLTHAADASLTNARQLINGSGISFNDATPGQRLITSTGGPPLPNKFWIAGAGALEVLGANAATVVGTAATPAKATGAGIRGYMAKRRQTSTTAANNVGSFRASNAADEAYAGSSGSATAAGLYLTMRFGAATIRSDQRFFAGLALNAAEAGTVDPSALLNCFGLGKDTGDANFQIIHNDGAGGGTKVDLGVAFADNYYELVLSVPSGGGSWTYTLTNLDTGVVLSNTISTNIPANDVPLLWRIWASTGPAGGTAVAVDGAFVKLRYPL